MIPMPSLRLSVNHQASGYAYVVAPAAASDKDLISLPNSGDFFDRHPPSIDDHQIASLSDLSPLC